MNVSRRQFVKGINDHGDGDPTFVVCCAKVFSVWALGTGQQGEFDKLVTTVW
jgi:hypothetical protein